MPADLRVAGPGPGISRVHCAVRAVSASTRPRSPAGGVTSTATAILATDWYQALCVWVAFNTLVFVFLSVLQLLPPLRLGSRLHGLAPRDRATRSSEAG